MVEWEPESRAPRKHRLPASRPTRGRRSLDLASFSVPFLSLSLSVDSRAPPIPLSTPPK